ncbi:MAG TPA: hypothetical protein DEG88_13035 [Propionibacteriaceae bacterium]|jgi:sucrose-6-phosphate hydrolase SacC (GH32 family)|uniref:beta-fructofuranosidase n=1 Tax=Candidatus Phosphoribacter hodrii TaxID=2953743 RepID=A0A934X6A9_9MICO|nr:glycoside hydrolase family 32 protein [Candidatus Phosphoribacter hodrii]HBX81261.1 hypothetical protein [Propionibacteriaceae bacterium]HBY24150.1 hypothetical protein [Propionibacteriaceae bacterium]
MSTSDPAPLSFDGDSDRPGWHFRPPSGWMNEPHGVLHHRARHHIFYQRNSKGPYWADISWGHAVSDNLIDWTDLGSALSPGDIPYSPDGVWSGSSAIDENDHPVLFFTAGDGGDHPNQRVAVARAIDPEDPKLSQWMAGPSPVVTFQDAAHVLSGQGVELVPGEFRDPFAWHENGLWHVIVGAGIRDAGGTALLFTAPLVDGPWTFRRPLLTGDYARRPDTGVMWELPSLVPLGAGPDGRPRHIFLATPWWPGDCEHSLQYQWYWIGVWDPATLTFTPEHDEPRTLDVGGYLTGGTPSRTPDGRILVWSITQDLLDSAEHRRRGWAGSAGVPLHLSLGPDNALRIAPAAEVKALRQEPLRIDNSVSSTRFDHGPMWDLELDLDLPVGSECSISLRQPAGGRPATMLKVVRSGKETVRVEVAGPVARGIRRATADHPAGSPLPVRVLADHSMVEAFVGEALSITTRAWTTLSEVCRIDVDAGAAILHGQVWPMRRARMTGNPREPQP